MMMRGKQTGRPGRVKQNDRRNGLVSSVSLARLSVSVGLIFALTACAPSVGGWRSPVKNEASTRADYAFCKDRAERATLNARQADRPGFGTANRTGTFNPRGDNTMDIAERSDTTNLYDALVVNCMAGKGYRQPGDPQPRGE